MVQHSSNWRKVLLRLVCVFSLLTAANQARASETHGVVTFAGLPVPGATVTITQGGKKYVTVTDTQGLYSFPTLPDGPAAIAIDMTGFDTLKQDLTIAPGGTTSRFELKLLSLDRIRAELKPVLSAPVTQTQARSEVKATAAAPKTAPRPADAPAPAPEELSQRAQDGLLVNGSVNNAATSQFTLGPRFGNTASGKSLYSYSLFVRGDSSVFDARSYSFTGIDTTKPTTSQLTGGFNVQGPLKIPHLLRNGPNIFVGYQRTRNSVSTTTPGLVPTLAERSGDFSTTLAPVAIYAPATLTAACAQAGIVPGAAFTGNKIPSACLDPAAVKLINLYPLPLPALAASSVYNYQVPLVTDTHVDSVNSNASKTLGRKNQLSGTLAASSVRTSTENLFGFVDANRTLGINSTVNFNHTFNAHLRMNLGYQYSRQSTRSTPFWDNRANISGNAGILGNDQDANYWGPPTLDFTSGITPLTDAQQSFLRAQTNGISYSVRYNHSAHNITAGIDFRRQEFNYLSQQNARGTFQFTGALTGSSAVAGSGLDLADFLLGQVDASSLGFGNQDKYLRQTAYDAYFTDDWRVNPQLTVNAGARYEYGSPVTEIKDRLVNLDVVPGFGAIAPVLASAPKGTLTGTNFPTSLTHPDRNGVEPRIGVSWRPIPGSSLLVSAGYGITFDSSVYQGIGLNFAQQAPLAKNQIAQYSAACPLTLEAGFNQCLSGPTFGVDPNFKVGYLQTWNLKLQRDLPESLQVVATYLGNKGTRGSQLFLPNTVPGGCNTGVPCGFEYITSYGDSNRESLQLQLRRRLTSGFTASVLYTWSKSIDDDSSLGGQGAVTSSGATIAQDWRNLKGERGLSSFDQRNLVNISVQYTTGMGKGGGTLLSGWKGRVYKEWTVQTQVTLGSGLPETPLYAAELVAGYPSTIRPNLTGAPLYNAAGFVNRLAYGAPLAGQYGNARRNSITGPSSFLLNTALVRTFRLDKRFNLDAQIASTNTLNHVSFTSYYNNVNSSQFGLPAAANAMRDLQTSLRLRF
jgi:hypothetical protein